MPRQRLLILVTLAVYSCNLPKTDKTETKSFEDVTTGWSTRHTDAYQVMTDKEIARLEGRGEEAMEETIGGELILSHKNLLWLKKDRFNSFTSNRQPFDSIADGPYEETEKLVYEALEETYRSQGIKYKATYGTTKIDGLDFTTMETIIYAPNSEKVLLNQVMYSRLIGGTMTLTLNINYNNDEDRELLLDVIKASKLAKRD